MKNETKKNHRNLWSDKNTFGNDFKHFLLSLKRKEVTNNSEKYKKYLKI